MMENCRFIEKRPPSRRKGLTLSPDRTNDKICIFGFSRGAYTARALAGMIHKVISVDKLGSDFALTSPSGRLASNGK